MDFDVDSLYHRYYTRLRKAAYRMCNNWDDAEDAVSVTFEKVCTNQVRIECEQVVTGWLYTILTNVIRDRFRRPVSREVSLDSLPDVHPLKDIRPSDTTRTLLQVIKSQPAGYREVAWAIIVLEKSYQEVADDLHISPNAVRSRLHKSRVRIRNDNRVKDVLMA